MHFTNRMLPNKSAQAPEPSLNLNASSSNITSFSTQQGSRWSPSDVGTVVFGCVASVLGILALWMTFRSGQRQPGHAPRSDGSVSLSNLHGDAAASDDEDVALGYLPHDGGADSEGVVGQREDLDVDTDA